MELSSDKIISLHPDTVEVVRKEFNLDKPGRIEEAVDILDDWVKKQQHFVKKDFSREYLERTLINSKGLVERAKQRLDRLCTLKTLMPNIFHYTDIPELHENIAKYISFGAAPKLTKDHCRVYLYKVHSDKILVPTNCVSFMKVAFAIVEITKAYDYSNGVIGVYDLREVNVVSLTAKMNIVEIRQAVVMALEGYGFRVKSLHIITASKMVDMLLSFVKQILSAKLVDRIHVHKSTESLQEYVPKEVLPQDFGGDEKPIRVLNEQWVKFISAEKHVEYLKDMIKATTNESNRSADDFNSQYLGTPGSFRSMVLD